MDPYVYPGTNVLKNLRDLQDLEDLATFEATATSLRIGELSRLPKIGTFDIPHLKAIHRHIFQDVFTWAGEFRTVNISRPGATFAFTQHIGWTLEDAFTKLRNENHLHGLGADQFCQRAGFYMGELNAIHPFRDGNGRTQREYIRQLGVRNGYPLHWSRITRDQMTAASKRSFEKADNAGLADLISISIQTQ